MHRNQYSHLKLEKPKFIVFLRTEGLAWGAGAAGPQPQQQQHVPVVVMMLTIDIDHDATIRGLAAKV